MKMVNTTTSTIVVGLGEVRFSEGDSDTLACLGLGSCVAVCAYDPVAKVGGMAHIVLPNSRGREGQGTSPKYADVGVPFLLKGIQDMGAKAARSIIKIAGGARMSQALGMENAFNIGENNIVAVKAALAKEGFVPLRADVGGNSGRALRLYMESGITTVSGAGREEREL